MRSVRIGIAVSERADLTAATLDALETAGNGAQVVLLVDGADAATRAALPRQRVDEVLAWDARRGLPACFNRLVCGRGAEGYVLLENGARVAPGWLERLLAALEADSSHGLAGPSTNSAWNEQRVFPDAGGSPRELAATARRACEQFGDSVRYLEPLHSLADFCYAVKREVIERIGAADEGYELGPCWEMDYNARAARAGFRAVWARSAYVWRAPMTPRRQREQARLFAAARRRYQDHFCGLRLRGESGAYEPHCKGEACPHFAPRELVQLALPFSGPIPEERANTPVAQAPAPLRSHTQDRPLVSCIMPTYNRRAYVPAAIEAFLAQDYEPRELIVVDDGADAVGDLMPADPRIRYVRETRRLALGAKRNLACSLARGEIVAHWDDDDWHAPWRLSYQVSELLAQGADLCGLDRLWFYDPVQERAWQYRYAGGPMRWIAGGTFCYRRSLWQRHRFAETTIGEDTRFVREASFARVVGLEREDFYVARVHAANTSPKHTAGASWHPVPVQRVRELLAREFAASAPALRGAAGNSMPLVSCIMPTAGRRAFVPLALELFARQTYPSRELIVVDDGRDAVRDLMPADERVRYIRLDKPEALGRKRNIGCEAARGEIVAHWDDDDWYGPRRLERQAAALISRQGEVTALPMTHVLELEHLRFWRCLPALHARLHYRDLCPGTVAYWHKLWRASGYPAINCTEDVKFLRALPAGARLFRLPEEEHFICVRHGANTWRIPLDWQRAPQGWSAQGAPQFLPEADRARYAMLARATARFVRPQPAAA
jgi:glycosyltransferase involved in cell wall biosynthesis